MSYNREITLHSTRSSKVYVMHVDEQADDNSYTVGTIGLSLEGWRLYPKRSLVRSIVYRTHVDLVRAIATGSVVFQSHLDVACRSHRVDHPDLMTVDCLLALEYKRRLLHVNDHH